MRLLLLLSCLPGLVAAQQLKVKSANARLVELEWTGTTGAATVERTSGGAMQKIATSDQGAYQDATIDRFATYRYRISTPGAKPSNEVIVGPPPAGVLNAAPSPKGSDAGKYGTASSIALDENGDPMIAFEWADPNGDDDLSDSEVRFVRWSRAAYGFLPAIRVQIVGDIATQNLNPISIACDRKSGVLAIGTPVAEKAASINLSTDGGRTWKATPVPGASGPVHTVAVALMDGIIHIVTISTDETRYMAGPVSESSSWKSQALPSSPGWKQPANVNAGLAMDRAGKPVIAWFEMQEDGNGRRFQIWRPGEKPGTALATTRNTDSPNLALTAGGGKIGLLVGTPLDEKDDDHGVWYLQSTDGVTWSKPSMPPVDGPRSTNPPLDVAIDSRGRVAAVFGSNSGSAKTDCNYPVLARSNDGAAWTTCGPGKAEGGDFQPQPATLHIIQTDNDKMYILWQEPSENKFHEGMLLWHER